jgi:hypothetical protein
MDYDELEEIYGGGLCRGFAEWQVTEYEGVRRQ